MTYLLSRFAIKFAGISRINKPDLLIFECPPGYRPLESKYVILLMLVENHIDKSTPLCVENTSSFLIIEVLFSRYTITTICYFWIMSSPFSCQVSQEPGLICLSSTT